MGKQAIDTDNNQVGQMLAALLSWPQATFASKIQVENKEVLVTREIDGGLQTLALTLPAVVTTDLRLNEPRYLSLPNIVKSKQKPLENLAADSLGIDLTPHYETINFAPPKKRSGGCKVATVAELVDRLRHEAQVIR